MVDTGGKEGVIEEGEREMIYGVFELGETDRWRHHVAPR